MIKLGVGVADRGLVKAIVERFRIVECDCELYECRDGFVAESLR